MMNQGYIEGVGVVKTSPYHFQETVDVSTNIQIEVNTALDKNTIFDAVKLIDITEIEDSYLNQNFEEVFESSDSIECVVKHIAEKNTIELEPQSYLETDKRYGIFVSGLKSTFDKVQDAPFFSAFYTSSIRTLNPIEPVFPKDNSVLDRIPQFSWIEQDTQGYVIEISKGTEFIEKVYEQVINQVDADIFDNTAQITPDMILDEDTYYWRVRSIGGNWSPVLSFYYQPQDIVPVSNEDEVYKDAAIAEILGEPFVKEVTTAFNVKEILVNPNMKTLMLEFNFVVKTEDIEELIIYSDEGHEPSFSYTVIENPDEDTSMVIISLETLGGDS